MTLLFRDRHNSNELIWLGMEAGALLLNHNAFHRLDCMGMVPYLPTLGARLITLTFLLWPKLET